jgi:raffinose/stachyose/melibiose transport system substrate-binding protein
MLVSAKSKYPDVAAKFIAWLVSPESAAIRAKNGMAATPASAVKPSQAETPTHREVLETMQTMSHGGIGLPWLDPSPRMLLEIYGSGLQEVLGGHKSASDFAKEVVAEQRAQFEERRAKGYAN